MQIAAINSAVKPHINFGRKLTKSEEADYQNNAIKPALKYLETEEVAMIIHGTCYPEGKLDHGVGSPFGTTASKFIPFEILHGFNSNQLGPIGVIRDTQHRSPYQSTVSTRNYLFLDYEKLTQPNYAELLSDEDIRTSLNQSKPNGKNYAESSFQDAFAIHNHLMSIANKNFKEKLASNDLKAIQLNNEFSEYKNKKINVVYKDALFNVLAKNYATPDFTKWDEIDKNLITRINDKDKTAIERSKQIIHRNKQDFDNYIFAQFLTDKQIKENKNFRNNLGFKYINDLLVGFSRADEWANQDLFMQNYRMGCPYGGKYGPQLWNIPVLDPEKLFKPDGTLGKAGVYLKKKLDDALEDCENIRIDHALGLVDPYIYDKNSVKVVGNDIDMSNFKGDNISHMHDIDPKGNYKRVLSEIVLPTLTEHGLDKNAPVWEDLVAETHEFNRIYHDELKLPGITQLEYRRGENYKDTQNWGLVGSHDSIPATSMIKKDWVRNGDAWNIFYLAGLLNSNPKRAQQRDTFCEKIGNNDAERIKAKFAELFLTCKKVQISFADFFGINKTYNIAGEENNTNWKLRLNNDYEDTYYKNLSSKNPTAINMPEILKMAVQAKADFVNVNKIHKQGLSDKDIAETNPTEVQNIIDNLTKYENILKESDTNNV
ncbi:MAG: 4-alpha-glucanotransferase [Muribaculaceae bacterium]|nr:4-alpha-glucanotransferase [Muribaculaceae bacterium]